MANLSTAEAEKLIASIAIPPRPGALAAVMAEQAKCDPNLGHIAKVVAGDVGLSAAMIKTVNSPFYGLRQKVTDVERAVTMLGVKNVVSLVTGLSLRNAVPTQGLDRFWDSAARTALLAAYLAKQLGGVNKDDAHLFGLFHDAGIPLMMRRFENYKETLKQANNDAVRTFTDVEDERHGTNHATVGSLLATSWQLPEYMRQAIALHHDASVFGSSLSAESLNLIAICSLAEYIENGHSRLSGDAEWEKSGGATLGYLMLGEEQLEELSRDARDMLEESGL
ncbi:MAG: HDOD domain-containing protein [Pseudomonadota bacterium]